MLEYLILDQFFMTMSMVILCVPIWFSIYNNCTFNFKLYNEDYINYIMNYFINYL